MKGLMLSILRLGGYAYRSLALFFFTVAIVNLSLGNGRWCNYLIVFLIMLGGLMLVRWATQRTKSSRIKGSGSN